MGVRVDDVWVVSIPKAGTTWTQEMVWLLMSNLDYEGAKADLSSRFPHLEYVLNFFRNWSAVDLGMVNGIDAMGNRKVIYNTYYKSGSTSMEIVNQLESPRLIKTHLPLNLLPPQLLTQGGKVIYVARNPKDQCVSLYHHLVLFTGYGATIDDFVDEYVQELSVYSPYWTHVREFWNQKKNPNVHFITYEDMKKDLPSVVKSTAKFLGKGLTEAELESLLQHISFEAMKANQSVNKHEVTENLITLRGDERKTDFIRKGKVGSWKEELSPESTKKLDDWIAKNKVDGIWEEI